VLYRLSAQSRLLIEAFDRSGIPYQTAGDMPLHAHKAVREVLAHLWLLYNPASRVHLAAVLAAGKPAFSAKAVERVQVPGTCEVPGTFQIFEAAASTGEFTAAPRTRLTALAAFYRQLAQDRPLSVARQIERIQQFVADGRGEPWSDADAQRLSQLALRAAPYADRPAEFLEAAVMGSETDAYDPRADRVALMTLHAAKGLEFPVVFIVGCEDGLLPYVRVARSETGHSDPADVEEERRLFYVGLTRAQHKLILTHSRTRFLYGQRQENPISRFVKDIDDAMKEIQEMQRRAPESKPESTQLSLF